MLKQCSLLNRLLFVMLLCGCVAAIANRITVASEPRPHLSPSPTPTPVNNAIAVIDSMVVNGVKGDSATAADIELLRAGATAPEATVQVGKQLLAGDRIRTKDQDQVTLRVPNSETGIDDIVFLDPNSEVAIGSICALAGRLLSWAGLRFRLCTSLGTLGVEGTEFEVSFTETGEATVLVYEGTVKLDPEVRDTTVRPIARDSERGVARREAAAPREGVTRRGAITRRTTKNILEGTALKLKSDGTTETQEVTPELKLQSVDYWSDQIIKASKPVAGVVKGFVNYSGDTQAEEFKKARREALIDNTGTAYLTIGKVLNDWNDGAAAQKSFAKITDVKLLRSAEYMVNVAEADRLQGRLAAAKTQIYNTLNKHPDYAPAYYLKAVVNEKVGNDPVEIRKNLAQALALDSGKAHLDAHVVEADLDRTIRVIGSESLTKSPQLAEVYQWFSPNHAADLIMAVGVARLEIGRRRAEGRAELAINGDQFKLKIDEQYFSGSLAGKKNAGGISLTMQFDNVGRTRPGDVLSVTGVRTGRGFTLTAQRQRAGSFTFTAERVISQ